MQVFRMTKKKAKFIAAFLCICLITGLSMNQAGLLQFTKADVIYTGNYNIASTKHLGNGRGTAQSPYCIDTAEDLAQFVYNVNNGFYTNTAYFKLTTDITITSGVKWTPIGDNSGHDFTGVFDGDGHTITGMNIVIGEGDMRADYLGFFGRTYGATISNLTISGATISQQSGVNNGTYVGALIGTAENTTITKCTATNCNITGNAEVGGLVGSVTGSSDSKIKGCVLFNSRVTATAKMAGGISGSARSATYINCYTRNSPIENSATGTTDPSEVTAGGIVGYSKGSVNIINCYNNSSITSSNIAGGMINGKIFSVRNCYNVGTITCSTSQFGSICGSAEEQSVIDRCFYLKTSTEVPYPSSANVTPSNVGHFANANANSFLEKESTNMSWNFTDNKTLLNALLEGSASLSTSYSDIVEWSTEGSSSNNNYPIHTAVPGHIHDDKGREVYSKYPTCTESGIVEKHCSHEGCPYYQVITLDPTGHSYESNPDQGKITLTPAACETVGYECWECTNIDKNTNQVCGHRTNATEIPALEHSWKSVTKDPSCTEDGYTRDECENGCGKVQNEQPIAKLGHDYELRIEAATCTEPEKRIETCKRCEDQIITASGSALGHDWDNVDGIHVDSSCVEQGGMLRTCQRDDCGYSEFVGERDPIASHVYSHIIVPPTCTEAGYTQYTCDVCGVIYKNLNLLDENDHNDYVAPRGHTFSNTVVAPTCSEKGYTRHECIDCDYYYDDAQIDATGRHFYEVDETKSKSPSCFADGITVRVCQTCGTESRTVTPAIGEHDYVLIPERSVPQTCTTGGYEFWECKVCLATERRNETEEGKGHSYTETVTSPDCNNGGYTTKVCSECGDMQITDRTDALGHDYIPTVIAATTTERGYTLMECSRCDASYECDYIAANPNASYVIPTETLVLSDIDELMSYSLDGGLNWELVEVSSVAVSADAINADLGIYVKRPGNTVLPLSDSAIQIVEVSRNDEPGNILIVPGNDERPGIIMGVDSTMEYRAENEDEWHDVGDREILEGLEAGVYYIRVKATDDKLASTPYRVVIKAAGEDDSPEPGSTTPPGDNTARPGSTTPPGDNTARPGSTTPPGNNTARPGSTTPPNSNNNNTNNSNNGNNSNNSNNSNNNANNNEVSGNGSNSNSSGTQNGTNGVSPTNTPGVIENSVYYSSNGGASSTGTRTSVSSSRAAKTGDDSNIVIWLMIASTAVCAVAITRKKKVRQ